MRYLSLLFFLCPLLGFSQFSDHTNDAPPHFKLDGLFERIRYEAENNQGVDLSSAYSRFCGSNRNALKVTVYDKDDDIYVNNYTSDNGDTIDGSRKEVKVTLEETYNSVTEMDGLTKFYSWSLYIPDVDFPDSCPIVNSEKVSHIISQWHSHENAHEFDGQQPVFSISYIHDPDAEITDIYRDAKIQYGFTSENDSLVIENGNNYAKNNSNSCRRPSLHNGNPKRLNFKQTTVHEKDVLIKGQWNDFIMRMKWSSCDDGEMELWINGRKVRSSDVRSDSNQSVIDQLIDDGTGNAINSGTIGTVFYGPNLARDQNNINNLAGLPYFKAGHYRFNIDGPATLYFGHFKTTNSFYEAQFDGTYYEEIGAIELLQYNGKDKYTLNNSFLSNTINATGVTYIDANESIVINDNTIITADQNRSLSAKIVSNCGTIKSAQNAVINTYTNKAYYDDSLNVNNSSCPLNRRASSTSSVKNSTVKIYPNPTESLLTMETINTGRYDIYNIKGILVKSGKLIKGKNIVNLNTIKNGVLFIKLVTDEAVEQRVVIKQMH